MVTTRFFELRKNLEQQVGHDISVNDIAKATKLNSGTVRSYDRGDVTRFDANVVSAFMTYFKLERFDQFFVWTEVDDEKSS